MRVKIQVITRPGAQITGQAMPIDQALSVVAEMYGVSMTGIGSADYQANNGKTWKINILAA